MHPWREGTFTLSTNPSNGGQGRRRRAALALSRPQHAIVEVRGRDYPDPNPPGERTIPADAAWKAGASHSRLHPPRITTVFAASGITTGHVTTGYRSRRWRQEFLKQAARAYPAKELHLAVDNYALHKVPPILAWPENTFASRCTARRARLRGCTRRRCGSGASNARPGTGQTWPGARAEPEDQNLSHQLQRPKSLFCVDQTSTRILTRGNRHTT